MASYYAVAQSGDVFILNQNDKHHLQHVLRAKINTTIFIIYMEKQYLAKIITLEPELTAKIIHQNDKTIDLACQTTLLVSLLKEQKFDWMLQKAVELGVYKIVPFLAENSVIKLNDTTKIKNKLLRWNKIIEAAAKQSQQLTRPILNNPIDLNKLGEFTSSVNIIAHEKCTTRSLQSVFKNITSDFQPATITIAVGPEGGFTEAEVLAFTNHAFLPVNLGWNILRAETATIYLLSIIKFLWSK